MGKSAVIFDMDGVVSDTQKFHAEAESEMLKDYHITMSPAEITKRFAGVADERMFKEIFDEHGVTTHPPIDNIVFQKWDIMATIAYGRITPIPHALELIKTLRANDFKLAIASASTKVFINEVLGELKITDDFDTLVSAQEVERGKPAPDIFLLAAKRLGVTPEESVVIEDGRSGMIGAAAAGIKCIGLIGENDKPDEYPATQCVTSLSQVSINFLHKL